MLSSFLSAKPRHDNYGESAALDLYTFLTEELCNTEYLHLSKLKPALYLLYLTGRMEKKTLDALLPIADKGTLHCIESSVDGTCTYTADGPLSSDDTIETIRPVEELGCFIISQLWSDRLCKEILPASVEGLKENGIREKTRFPVWFQSSSPAALENASYINGYLLLPRNSKLGHQQLVLHRLSSQQDPDCSFRDFHTDSELILSKNFTECRRTINSNGKWFYWKEAGLLGDQPWYVMDLNTGDVQKTDIEKFLCTDETGFDYAVSKGLICRITAGNTDKPVFLYDKDSRYIPCGKGILEMNEVSKINPFIIYHDPDDSRTANDEETEMALFHCFLEFDRIYRSLNGSGCDLQYHMKIQELSVPPRPFTAKTLSGTLKSRWNLLAQNITLFSHKHMEYYAAADRFLFDHPELIGDALYESICKMLRHMAELNDPDADFVRNVGDLRHIRRPVPSFLRHPASQRFLDPADMDHADWLSLPDDEEEPFLDWLEELENDFSDDDDDE